MAQIGEGISVAEKKLIRERMKELKKVKATIEYAAKVTNLHCKVKII